MSYQSLINKSVLIYLLLVFFPARIFITDSSYIEIFPFGFLLFNIFMYILRGKFALFNARDLDTIIIIAIIVYSIFSAIFGTFMFLGEWLSILQSLVASIMLVSLFFVSKNLNNNWNFDQIIKITIYGSLLLLLYLATKYYFSPQFYIEGVRGRTMNQRGGLYMSFIFIFSIWGILHLKEGFIKKIVFLLTFFVSFYYLIFSYSIGAYLLLIVIFLSLSITYIKSFKYLIYFLLITLLLSFLFFQFNENTHVIQRFSRLTNILESVKLDHSAYERWLIWSWISEYLLNNPLALLFGTGNSIDAFNVELLIHDTYEPIYTAESMYFDILLRTGMIGLLLQFLVFLRMIQLAILNKKYFNSKYLGIYFIIFMICTIVYNIYEPSLRDRSLGMFFYFLYGYLSNLHSRINVKSPMIKD